MESVEKTLSESKRNEQNFLNAKVSFHNEECRAGIPRGSVHIRAIYYPGFPISEMV